MVLRSSYQPNFGLKKQKALAQRRLGGKTAVRSGIQPRRRAEIRNAAGRGNPCPAEEDKPLGVADDIAQGNDVR